VLQKISETKYHIIRRQGNQDKHRKAISFFELKKKYSALIIVIVIVGSLVGGYLIGSGRVNVPYLSGGTNSTTSSVSTACTASGQTNGVVLKVVQDNYSSRPPGILPVAGANVTVSDVYYCGNVKHEGTFIPSVTNSSGLASLLFGGAGMYYLTIHYHSPANYTLSVPVAPLATTFVTYNISTGNLSASVCYYSEHC
jgi:hypothetical protein